MGAQSYMKGIVNIAPFRMVVLRFTFEGNSGHDRKSFFKVLEFKGRLNRPVRIIPPFECF